jgi:hypothetical protein
MRVDNEVKFGRDQNARAVRAYLEDEVDGFRMH